MPVIDFSKSPFLTEEQEAVARNFSDVQAGIQAIPYDTINVGPPIQDALADLRVVANTTAKFSAQNRHSLSSEPTNSAEVETRLQLQALTELNTSKVLGMTGQLALILAARAVASGEDMESVHGYEFTLQVVRQRAQREAAALLTASNLLLESSAAMSDEQSIWDAALMTHAKNRRLKPPVTIYQDESLEGTELVKQVLDINTLSKASLLKVSGSSLVQKVRVGRQLAKGKRAGKENTTLDQLAAMVESGISIQIPDLSDEQIKEAARIAHRRQQYVQSAARANRSLAEDPRTRYGAFLGQHLTSHDLRSEHAKVKRLIEKRAESLQRALGQKATNAK